MADTKGGSFFGSVEEYVAARGGNRVIKKVRRCTLKHLLHEMMSAVSLALRQHECQPNVCIRATSVFHDADTRAGHVVLGSHRRGFFSVSKRQVHRFLPLATVPLPFIDY